ncbi:SurA N-terminal domain-containing protein [Bradyrhizobium sp. 2TAF24]|uniref:peptidylprolyl isomerase n=1 Tax=Bradyrhizobium sp. 2TAF24 TaxID=3233011 RepID=UPI003F901CAB
MRKASSNWLGKTIMATVMGVLIISFGIWGIADIFRGFGQSKLATIGGVEISTEQFRQLYNDKLQQISRQFGRPLTSEQARAFGLDRQLLQQTIAETALDEGARRMGLGQSDAEIIRSIHNDPNFKGATGSFDPARFAQIIRQFGYSEQRYIAEQRKVSLRRQIAATYNADLEPAKTQLDVLNRYQNEQRTVDFLRLSAAQVGAIEAPSPEALASYFEEHKAAFRAPEYRKIAVVIATPDELAKWTAVSDEDARKAYSERLDSLSTPEKRQVSQIVFPNADEAKAARERIAGGLSFDDLARERKLSAADVDLGLVAKSAIIDAAIADAAFALKADEVSQPVQGRFGVALVKVSKVEPGTTPSYELVAPKLKRDLALDQAKAAISNLYNKMEDERGGGAGVVEAAQKAGLKAITIDAVDRSGRTPNGQQVQGLPQGFDLVSAAFASNVNVENDPQQYNGGYLWYDVLDVTPSRDRTLDEVKAEVETRWKDDQIASRLRDKAKDMVAKLEGGATLADQATASGVKVETSAPLKRDARSEGVPATLAEAAFRTAKDGYGQSPGASSTEIIVYRVTAIGVPTLDLAADDLKKMKDGLRQTLADEQIGQYIARLQTDLGVTINQTALAVATGAANSN